MRPRGTPFANGRRRRRRRSIAKLRHARSSTMNVPGHTQAIRVVGRLLLVALVAAAACAGDDVAWTDPLTMASASGDARLTLDTKGRARLVADTSISVHPTRDTSACAGSVRAARLDDGTVAAARGSVRPHSHPPPPPALP